MTYIDSKILVLGNGKLKYSVAVCLSQGGDSVTLITEDEEDAKNGVNRYLSGSPELSKQKLNITTSKIIDHSNSGADFTLAIGITNESLSEKRSTIEKLEKNLSSKSVIAINTEVIPLSVLQQGCLHPQRIIGLNWVEPAHTTYFLEIISNEVNDQELVKNLEHHAGEFWGKDPYIISSDTGIRAKLISGMAREAFYLVENGYASIEDIDRACRNDAGYYLPFAGNFRYMDLMGTYAYGLVMKDLNRELSNESEIPGFFKKIMEEGGKGMENGNGFYNYDGEEVKKWHQLFNTFSYKIRNIVGKYPFNYVAEKELQTNEK